MHFSVLAITPQRPDQAALDELLWPWCFSNPDVVAPKWDWFNVGGVFGAMLDPDGSVEDPGRIWDVSQKEKKHLDVAALQARAVMQAAGFYDRVQEALSGRHVPNPVTLVRIHGEPGWRAHWSADPAVHAATSVIGSGSPETIFSFMQPRPVMLATARRCALLTTAVVQGNLWYETKLWDFDKDPARTEDWAHLSTCLIEEAAQDAWFTIVDCHR